MAIMLLVLLLAMLLAAPNALADAGAFWGLPERKTSSLPDTRALLELLPIEDYTLLSPGEAEESELVRWYCAAYAAGKVPLIIAVDENLTFTVRENLHAASLPDTLKAAEALYAQNAGGMDVPPPAAVRLSRDMAYPSVPFAQEWLLVTLRADAPWQVPALVPFGGWNDCPPPAEQAAALRDWQNRFGAVPCLMTSDSLSLLVDRPPQSPQEALPLAQEMLAFCEDLYLGFESAGDLAQALSGAGLWYFWWD